VTARWAPVLRGTRVRAAPSRAAPSVGSLAAATPEGTVNIVLAVGRRAVAGRLWLRVASSSDAGAGWIPRTAVGGYVSVRTRLVVDLERLRATLFARGRPVFEAPIGVGKPTTPTPRGAFYVRDELTAYRSPFYGPLAFGTSARSVLTDWPAGGFIGIHGTNRPDLIPGRVSHGCIRLKNADLLRLAQLMPVGTPLLVR
jgi:lipoprotein-anchoring transpeptidase ErfK/SrfK